MSTRDSIAAMASKAGWAERFGGLHIVSNSMRAQTQTGTSRKAAAMPLRPAGEPLARVSGRVQRIRVTHMIIDLTGLWAVVTGSTSGIGFAIVRGLAGSGAAVVVNGRSQKNVDTAVARLTKELPQAKVEGVTADLATADGAAALVARVPVADILVNNLGIFEPKPFGEISDADWLRFFETNVMSGVRMSRHYLPGMVAKGWGRVVFISSESGLHIPTEMIHYGTTKTAQLAISRGLAETVAGTGVTVNAVLPGPTRSEGVAEFFAKLAKEQGVSTEELEKRFVTTNRPTSLLKRIATVEEVANMVVYVCSREASATTGAALRVDGGVVRSIA
jgi:NAD(P)-dependent dehydrogenase (short-subunit alcohol dehydrogenase family)